MQPATIYPVRLGIRQLKDSKLQAVFMIPLITK